MIYHKIYITPHQFNDIVLTSDGEFLIGVNFIADSEGKIIEHELPIFKEVTQWLDEYFLGHNPNITFKYKIANVSSFTNDVLQTVKNIEYGKYMTYGEIASKIAENRHIKKMSAQAVGTAIGKNPLIIVIPCHRVLASNQKLGGYSAGINNKRKLLKLEHIIYK